LARAAPNWSAMLFDVMLLVAALVAVLWAAAAFHLQGADHSEFDADAAEDFPGSAEPSAEARAVVASVAKLSTVLNGVPRRQHTAVLRKYMDEMFAERQFNVSFTPLNSDGLSGEWVQAPGADSARRTLYIHGGAWIVGSALSHRTLTSRLAEMTGGAVLAINYRLMPEHRRIAGIEDCRKAWLWLLENGPNGAEPARSMFVGGDSAGGNLTLSLIAWLRDQGHRAPDAALAFSPATDATLGSPSLKSNLHSDAMLGPLFGRLAAVPRAMMLWAGFVQTRINPSDPTVSPLHGDLSRLPPLLVQASRSEMLIDDARRDVN
jgi:acetyl esterase/lipase